MKKTLTITTTILMSLTALHGAETVRFVEPSKPYDSSPAMKTPVGDVNKSGPLQMPIITWAADAATILLNSGMEPKKDSELARATGRPVALKLENVLDNQVADYISGKSPFIRGTSGQIALVAGALKNLDPKLEPIVFVQLSRSTGADMLVAKNLPDLSALKGKTVITQVNGVHPEILANILRDSGLKATDINIKYVANITDPAWKPGQPINDPANALRFTPDADATTVIDLDGLALTGGSTGTGLDGTVKGAKIIFSTKSAPNLIFDTIAVRRDFLEKNPGSLAALRDRLIQSQDEWKKTLSEARTKSKSERQKIAETLKMPAKILLDDPNLAPDLAVWMGEGADLAGKTRNNEFFLDSNPNGFSATTTRIQDFYKELGLISAPVKLAVAKPGVKGEAAPVSTPAKKTFATVEAVRKAADSTNAQTMMKFTFAFNPQESEVRWQDYPDTFDKIHETATRYGGAIIQVRGHGDNFFYKFVKAKRDAGQTSYQKKDKATGQFSPPIPLPELSALTNDSTKLSYTRAFNVKKAYAAYLREKLGLSSEEADLSRFDIKGMGISQPLEDNPQSANDRAKNMRCEVVIIAAESEIPSDLSADDLR